MLLCKGKQPRASRFPLKFCCLSRVATTKPPTGIRERTVLLNADLGDASILFRMDATRLDCHQEIVSKFPKLLITGYELLLYQRGEDAGVLQHPFPSYSTMHKGCYWKCQDIYIRPLQKDLDESVVGEPAVLSEVVT